MGFQITRTADGIKTYPLHKHKTYEIMLYLHGQGYLKTPDANYPFSPGTIIIVPPGIMHGSSSENGFCNIAVIGKFEHLLKFEKPVILTDNGQQEGKTLSTLIFNNRYASKEYLSALCSAYIYFLLKNLKPDDNLSEAVNKIISEITDNAFDHNISLNSILTKSGYAEDYIRAHFKKVTGKTPNGFLTKIRIDNARFLINIYGENLSLSQIAEQCGYVDYVYFSKKFRAVTGLSPKEYKLSLE